MYKRAKEILKEYENELNRVYGNMIREVIFTRREMNRIKWSRHR